MDKNQNSPPKKIQNQIELDFGSPKSSEGITTPGEAKKDGRGTRTPLKTLARGKNRPHYTKQTYTNVQNPYEWGEENNLK